MTTVLLASIMVLAALTLVGVLWSIVRFLVTQSADGRLRREGVRATGIVVDNTMTSTPQRRLLFSPVVEFRALTGTRVSAPARQSAATSWPRGASVEVSYDPDDPTRFVLAGEPQRGRVVANTIVGVIVVGIFVGTMVAMYHVWWEFRYDKGTQPTSIPGAPLQPGG